MKTRCRVGVLLLFVATAWLGVFRVAADGPTSFRDFLEQERKQANHFGETGQAQPSPPVVPSPPAAPTVAPVAPRKPTPQDSEPTQAAEKSVPSAPSQPEESAELSPFYAVIRSSVLDLRAGRDPMQSNYVTILNNGLNALILRLHLIRHATKSIDVQTFIYRYDDVGRLLMYELLMAARRGVKVRILADHIASERDRTMAASFAMAHPNLEIRHYRPLAGRMDPSPIQETLDFLAFNRTNQRMHNKLFLVDELIGLTGGRNIENCYFGFSPDMNFKDRDVLVVGPVCTDMRTAFGAFWDYEHSIPSGKLKDIADLIATGDFPRLQSRDAYNLDDRFDLVSRAADDNAYITEAFLKRMVKPTRLVLLVDTPGKNRRFNLFSGSGRITRQIEEVMAMATESLVIQSPYLVLDAKTRRFLRRIKKKQPRMRMVVSSNSFAATDNILAYSANYRLRSAYIERIGMEVYEYRPHPANLLQVLQTYPDLEARAKALGLSDPPFVCLHAKSFVVDQRHTFIGSFNLDPRSANLNTEIGILIDDPVVASLVKTDILRDCHPRNSWVIAKRRIPLGMGVVNGLIESSLRHTPIDIWPLRNTTSFDLIPGKEALAPGHPDFYKHYTPAGDLPGVPSGLSSREAVTLLLKTMGRPLEALL